MIMGKNESGRLNALSPTAHHHDDLYEPKDAAIVKSDETETITAAWTMGNVDVANLTVRSVNIAEVFLTANDGSGNDLLQISRETGNVIKFTPYTTGSFQFTKAVTCDSTFTATNFIDPASDVRLKKNIEEINKEDINNFDKVNVVSFEYKEAINDINKDKQFGVIAQELKELYPSLVYSHNDRYGVNYQSLAMLTLSKVQSQQKEINALRDAFNTSIWELIKIKIKKWFK